MCPNDLNEEPIFLLGVGRCGSTFEQTWLNRTGKVWIWGEHGGVVGRFLVWGEQTRSNQNLRKLAFPYVRQDIEALINSDLRADATHIAWMNGFADDDIHQIERSVISRLFRTRLPAGRTRWGFKEIRYGQEFKVAERLLQLFPAAKIVHTLRHPFGTVESSLAAWNPVQLDLAIRSKEVSTVADLYQQHLDRWQATTQYFLDLESHNPRQVYTSKLETFQENIPAIIGFLNIPLSASEVPAVAPINTNARKPGSESHDLFSALRAKISPAVADLAVRAGYDM